METSVLHSRDTFVLMATGQGKSLCYQLPALVTGKPVVVISPLISLMEDQVMALQSRGITACHLSSAQADPSVPNRALQGHFKLIYMSPERLTVSEDYLRDLVQNVGVCLFAGRNYASSRSSFCVFRLIPSVAARVLCHCLVDESHCISEWGHDFRSAYREVSVLRQWFPGVPICALTATATPTVSLSRPNSALPLSRPFPS